MATRAKSAMAGQPKGRLTGRGRYEITAGKSPRVAESVPATLAPAVRVISATEAARNFSDLINRVAYKGEAFVVERGGRPMCRLSPVDSRRCTGADLLGLLAALPQPAEEFLAGVEELARDQATIEPSAWEK